MTAEVTVTKFPESTSVASEGSIVDEAIGRVVVDVTGVEVVEVIARAVARAVIFSCC